MDGDWFDFDFDFYVFLLAFGLGVVGFLNTLEILNELKILLGFE